MSKIDISVTSEERIEKLIGHFEKVLTDLGLDKDDPSIVDTPRRMAKMYVNELCHALYNEPPKLTTFENTNEYTDMLIQKDISFYSMCEHHFVPIHGRAHIAYIPGEKVMGLSKFSRIVKYCAAKPQLQERLNSDIVEILSEALQTENIAVVIEAKHLCCSMRGVKDPDVYTVTSHLGGVFKKGELRQEFMSLVNNCRKL